jgi:hypothetical protein
VYAYEELALDAAIRGGRHRVYDALLAHPLVGQADQAECLTDRLLAENAKFLPGRKETEDEPRAWSALLASACAIVTVVAGAAVAAPASASAALAAPQVRVNQVGYPTNGLRRWPS